MNFQLPQQSDDFDSSSNSSRNESRSSQVLSNHVVIPKLLHSPTLSPSASVFCDSATLDWRMERTHSRTGGACNNTNANGYLSYSDLFNLESLMNFQLPQQSDDFDSSGNSSRNESRSSQGAGDMPDHVNGFAEDRSTDSGMSRRRWQPVTEAETESASNSSMREEPDSNDEDDGNFYNHISEEHYRSMLGEHVQKYQRMRYRDSTLNRIPTRAVAPVPKRNHSKVRRSENPSFSPKEERVAHNIVNSSEYYDIASQYGGISSMDSLYLDVGEGIAYRIPPTYDKLAKSLRLPGLSDTKIDENYLKGNLDMQSLSAMIAIDRKYHFKSNSRMGDTFPHYESLQAKLKSLPACNLAQKFSLQVCEIGLDSSAIPEGAAGKIRRLILSESGILEVHYVRIMEKGDTYEIIERSLPKKQVVVKDPLLVEKEMMEKISKNWANMARKDIAKHHRIFTSIHRKQLADAKRCSETCQREVKLKISRSLRYMKQASTRTRKLTRDALVFMKRMEKEQAELKKKEEKEAAEALKREEELRETKRQQQRLNFLISQTELYSHFMQNKPTPQVSETLTKSDEESALPVPLMSANKTGEEEDAEDAELKREALKAAQLAVSQQKRLTDAFDSECQRLRQVVEPDVPATDAVATGSSNIDLLHPSTMPLTSSVQTPEMFKGTLKEYQLKGLQWLVNCYEQGLNGILADEMGLGKTIQAMAFLGHLAEEKNIWGPFLVVAPSSVLNNWVDEVNRFCPELKTLPYWGGAQERAVLRKNINPKRLYRRESAFHILITSYQLLVYDEKCLRRVKWQYMVLDEAQAIKSSSSIRWKTLLSFNCRNRLLLTGTPIQNNMAELWALLHFIMPTLFDSHEQFNEWFSKGIENHAEHGGTLNEHQLSRLHAVLKPFMLRRVKKDVISEMTGKTEVTVHCKLSSRQQAFYQAIKNKISLTELIDVSRGSLNEKKFLNLMNIVIQLRKVCNHPELFERNEGSSYAYFAEIPFPLLSPPFGELEVIHYPGGWNPIKYKMPKLVHQEIARHWVSDLTHFCGAPSYILGKLNIFLPQNVYNSTLPHDNHLDKFSARSGAFGFTRLIELSPVETYFLANSSVLEILLFSVMRWDRIFLDEILDMFLELEGDTLGCDNLEKAKVRAVSRLLITPTKSDSYLLRRKFATGPGHAPFEALVVSHMDRFMSNTRLLRSIYSFIPRARAPPINAICSDRSFAQQGVEELHNPWIKRLLLGFARTSEFNGPHMPSGPHHLIEEMDSQLSACQPILQLPYEIFGSSPPIQNFDPAKMLTESGKLKMLDILLKGLRAENHRVLLFAQMTKMLDILEDYMNYRKYKYLRLDGSSSIGDRRDMVWDFQNRSDIFVFLLSTRAGGLGINLTAADTVIFYESDWNPTLDLQAMDRAHRLGQTKEVTVYRLICQETVEEKILQRASQKNTVQQLVMTGGHVQDDLLKSEDVVSLLLDDSQLQQKLREIPAQVKDRQKKKRPAKGVRITADGDATIENLDQIGLKYDESVSELENGATTTKKRKSVPKAHVSNLKNRTKVTDLEPGTEELEGDLPTLPHRTKKAKKEKSVNEYLELVGGLPSESDQQASEYPPHSQYFESPTYGNGEELGYTSQTPSPSPG